LIRRFQYIKVHVRIKTATGEIRRKCKIEDDGKTIIIQKPTKKKYGWKIELDMNSLIRIPRFLRPTIYAVDVVYGAFKAITYDYKNPQITQNLPSFQDMYDYNRADIVKVYKQAGKKQETMLTWIMLFALLITTGLSFMMAHRMGIF
jgi:hypothetical protein